MIKFTQTLAQEGNGKMVVRLWADTKAEVTGELTIIGMPNGQELSAGSYVVTGDFHIGQLLSDGTWSWDDSEESASTKSLNVSRPSLTLEKTAFDELEEVTDEIEEVKE